MLSFAKNDLPVFDCVLSRPSIIHINSGIYTHLYIMCILNFFTENLYNFFCFSHQDLQVVDVKIDDSHRDPETKNLASLWAQIKIMLDRNLTYFATRVTETF